MEFESDDDVAEQSKNTNHAKKEGKVRVTKKTVHYYEFTSKEEEGAHADPKKIKKTHDDHTNSRKKDENDQALVSNEMILSSIGSNIFIGDSAATSLMTNNKTEVYDLQPIRGSVMIGNGESISCTDKGKLDVICKHKDGSTAKHTWEVKIVPQLNHDLFSFTKAMKEKTPQQNSVVERKLPTLMGRSRAMMLTAGFSQQDKRKFWCEVISTATKLDNIMVKKERTTPPFTLFYNDEAKYTKVLRSFGEMAVIAISDGKKMRSKLDTRGRTGIFVGYADNHAGNVYRFINIQTKKIILSRDIQWLNSFWKEYKKREDASRKLVDVFYSHDEDDQTQEKSEADEPNENEEEESNNSGDGNNTEEEKRLGIDIQMIGATKEELGRTRSQPKEMMSPRNESMERAELTMEDWIHETCLISAVTSGPTEPKTFQEAWHSPVEEERHNWQVAIWKEIKSMINIGVWRKIDKVKMPENRRLIGNKWVFKIKRDGTYRARLVALGYSQIPGVDHTDNFAPVAHDVSFRIALARMMVEKLDSLVMDVETAFLYGDIEEEIFMKSPTGMEEIDPGSSPEDCYELKKGIYGLCQAARQFWEKFVDTIKKEPFGFTVSPADPCMLFKKNNLGLCIIIMYVDDMLVIGKKEQI